jgi:hypothetical protein
MAQDVGDDSEGWIAPEVLATQVSIKDAVDLRAEARELRVAARHVCVAVEGEGAHGARRGARKPVLAQVAVHRSEDVGA